MSQRFELIAEGVAGQPLLDKLAEHPDLWTKKTARQSYPGSAHQDTESIYLRWAVDESVHGGFYCVESQDHLGTIRTLAPEVFGLLYDVLRLICPDSSVGALHDVGRVMLVKLKPHGHIAEHVDEGPYADRYDRFHLCLAGASSFVVETERQVMRPGELWWFNHKKPHTVENEGEADRIHLIIDLVAPAYRKLRGLTFQRERPHELLDEARPLFEAHYHEIAHYQDIPLDINEEAYRQCEELGLLRCFTARYNGELVGYCVFMVRPNLRYSSSIQAVQDILFIDKTKRGALFGKRLLEFCEQRLKGEGVQVVYQHAKVNSTASKFFEAVGYTLIDSVYGKRLDQ